MENNEKFDELVLGIRESYRRIFNIEEEILEGFFMAVYPYYPDQFGVRQMESFNDTLLLSRWVGKPNLQFFVTNVGNAELDALVKKINIEHVNISKLSSSLVQLLEDQVHEVAYFFGASVEPELIVVHEGGQYIQISVDTEYAKQKFYTYQYLKESLFPKNFLEYKKNLFNNLNQIVNEKI